MDEYLKEVEEVVDDEYFGESYDKEQAWKDEFYKEGLEQGIEQGSINKSMEIAKSLLEGGIDIEIIRKSTGLSIEEIEKLK